MEGFGKPQTVDLELRPAWGGGPLRECSGRCGRGRRGVSIGQTPLDAEILRGEPTIVVSLEGRKSVTLLPEIEAGERLSFVDIVLDPLDGRLVISQ